MGDDKYSIVDLKKFLGTEDRPVSNTEFQEFWRDLTEEEKKEFKNSDLGMEE